MNIRLCIHLTFYIFFTDLETMELCEELLQRLPADIGEDIEPPPVRHPHHHALHTELSGPVIIIIILEDNEW